MMRLSWKWRVVPIAVVGIVYLSLTAFKKEAIENRASESTQVKDADETSRVPASAATEEVAKGAEAQVSAQEDVTTSVVVDQQTISVPKPEALKSFKTIQAKVFRNKEDERKWKKLISDSKYILELSAYLKELPKLDPQEFKENQNAVIDLLVEALRGGD